MTHRRIAAETRQRIYTIAALAHCDHRAARKALLDGVDTVRGDALRLSLAQAIAATEPRKSDPPPAAA